MVDVNCSADGRNVVTNVHQTGKTELLGLVLFRVDVIILLDFVRIDVVSNRFQGNSIVLIPFMRRGFCVGMVLMKRAYFDVWVVDSSLSNGLMGYPLDSIVFKRDVP